jgi:hypothetical protein
MKKERMTMAKYNAYISADPRIVKQNVDGSDYVPITIVQEDLFEVYNGLTKMELLRETFHKGGLSGIGRLHYFHPVLKIWLFQDGSASIPFMGGMRLDFPNLGSRVLLSAAKKIGKRFGQLLNRDREEQTLYFDNPEPTVEEKRWMAMINDCKTTSALEKYKEQIPEEMKGYYEQKLIKLLETATNGLAKT